MQKTKFAFFGTDSIAICALEELSNAGYLPAVIICSPDKPKGRGLSVTPPPSKIWALEKNIPVIQPIKLDDVFLVQLKQYGLQFGVVASYGKIISEPVLNSFQLGLLNIHPSLLPKLRGPSPIESTILTENTAGVSIIKIDREMDHGPILAQRQVNFSEWPPRYKDAEKILGSEGGRILAEILPNFINDETKEREQNHGEATFTKKITKEDALIDLSGNPAQNLRKIRAYEEWPGAYFFYESNKGKTRIKITEAHIEAGQLMLDKVVPEGKKEMSWVDFKKGN